MIFYFQIFLFLILYGNIVNTQINTAGFWTVWMNNAIMLTTFRVHLWVLFSVQLAQVLKPIRTKIMWKICFTPLLETLNEVSLKHIRYWLQDQPQHVRVVSIRPFWLQEKSVLKLKSLNLKLSPETENWIWSK